MSDSDATALAWSAHAVAAVAVDHGPCNRSCFWDGFSAGIDHMLDDRERMGNKIQRQRTTIRERDAQFRQLCGNVRDWANVIKGLEAENAALRERLEELGEDTRPTTRGLDMLAERMRLRRKNDALRRYLREMGVRPEGDQWLSPPPSAAGA